MNDWGERWNTAIAAGWRDLARSSSTRSAPSDDSVQWIISPVLDNIMSGVAATHSSEDDVEADIDRVLGLFADSPAGGLWLLRADDKPGDLPTRLARRGLLLAGSGMGAAVRDLTSPPLPTDVRITRATTVDDIDDWEAVAVAVWPDDVSSASSMAELYRNVVGTAESLQVWVARIGQRPVGMSTAFLGDDIINVEYVGVVPEFRLRGIGSAVTHAPVAALAADCQYAVIGESEESASVYRRLGFQPLPPAGPRFAVISRNRP